MKLSYPFGKARKLYHIMTSFGRTLTLRDVKALRRHTNLSNGMQINNKQYINNKQIKYILVRYV
jgi:hypothetical protein